MYLTFHELLWGAAILLLLAAACLLLGAAAAALATWRLMKGLPPVQMPRLPRLTRPKPAANGKPVRQWPKVNG